MNANTTIITAEGRKRHLRLNELGVFYQRKWPFFWRKQTLAVKEPKHTLDIRFDVEEIPTQIVGNFQGYEPGIKTYTVCADGAVFLMLGCCMHTSSKRISVVYDVNGKPVQSFCDMKL
mgnify:FL=1